MMKTNRIEISKLRRIGCICVSDILHLMTCHDFAFNSHLAFRVDLIILLYSERFEIHKFFSPLLLFIPWLSSPSKFDRKLNVWYNKLKMKISLTNISYLTPETQFIKFVQGHVERNERQMRRKGKIYDAMHISNIKLCQ